jgi:hypothetical protein
LRFRLAHRRMTAEETAMTKGELLRILREHVTT